MSEAVTILIVEDVRADFLLIERHLKKHLSNCRCRCVSTMEELLAAMDEHGWDVVLSDYNLPGMKFEEVLSACQIRLPGVPCILVSGSVGDEKAVELLKHGVWDFILKDNPVRLVPAIQHSLREAADRRARRAAEEALFESEEKFRKIFQSSPDPIVIVTLEDGRNLDANDAFLDFTGFSITELLGRTFLELDFWLTGEEMESFGFALKTAGSLRVFETRFQTRHGIRSVLLSADVLNFRQYACILIVIKDITERKRAEDDLRKAHALLQNTFNTIPDLLTVHDRNLRVVFSNWYGREHISEEERSGTPHCYACYMRRDKPCKTCPTLEAFRTGRAVSMEIPNPYTQRICEVNAYPVFAASGAVELVTEHVRDITDRKRSEEQRALVEARMRQAQKLEALGTLAGGVAHDFNNILGIIMGYAELSRMETEEGSSLADNLREVLNASERAKELVKQILTFSRMSEQCTLPLQLGTTVKEAMKILRPSLPSTIEIKTEVSSKSAVLADPTQIHQVLMNLCTNAAHAMRERGGVLEVILEDILIGDDLVRSREGIQPGPGVKLTVKDTGEGIDPAILDSIFDPFFTTKGLGEGTGLGLSVVHGIVKGHGGSIDVESTIGEGTTFTVIIPASQVEDEPVEKEVASPLPGGSEHILVVDDEPMLANVLLQMLTKLGYDVVFQTSGLQALEACRTQSKEKPFDLVITDMTMPHLTGADLVIELSKLRSGTPVILMTGFSEKIDAEKAKKLGVQGFLMKPVELKDLAHLVRKVLDKTS
ncbi:MAG: response regulator [Syntrophobacteraceae bacterium]